MSPPRSALRSWLPVILGGGLIGTLILALLLLNENSGSKDSDFEVDPKPIEFVGVPGGQFLMGNENPGKEAQDETPLHEVKVDAFQLGKTEITNGQFAAFVKATGYKTVAEHAPSASRYPGARPELLVPGSAKFTPVEAPLYGPWETGHPPWWQYQPGANWRHPDGPGSTILGKMNDPVVHIAWDDAQEFCKWAGTRLPTEAEWEYAARGGLTKNEFTWGTLPQGAGGKWFANTFQGDFPHRDSGADGYAGRAPVAQYPPNGFGLHDMSGNVWEWCEDYYDPNYYSVSPRDNPKGPPVGKMEGNQMLRVRRGGSYLCAENYCRRFVPSAWDNNPSDSGASHTGFRVAK